MKKLICLIGVFPLLVSLSCGRIKKTDAEIERENWIAGFTDSVDYYKKESGLIEEKLEKLNSVISSEIGDFEMVRNPREVSGYYILKGWSGKIPFTTTGVYARINENEKLELIATLAGATFNCIEVGTSHDGVKSEIVPHDQAFNFRHQRFNTVYFSGGKADSIAEYIADHKNEIITLKFIEKNKINNLKIPENEKQMISKTWKLYSSQAEAKRLQKELWIYSRKIDTFRRMMNIEE